MSPKLQGETLGERIAYARKIRELRKVDLRHGIGELLGKVVNSYYPHRWEINDETPGDEYMNAISKVTMFPVEEFYAGLGRVPTSLVSTAKRTKRADDAVDSFIRSGILSPYQPAEVQFLKTCALYNATDLEAALVGYRLSLAPDEATRKKYVEAIMKLGPTRSKPESSLPKKPTPPRKTK